MARDFARKRSQQMMGKIWSWTGIMMVLLMAVVAHAQTPDVRVWISGPKFVTPSAPTEYMSVYFRNKSDATAFNTVITITLPPGINHVGGSSNPYNAGDLGVSDSVYSYTLDLSVGDTVAVGAALTVTAECRFDDGVNPYTTNAMAIIDVVRFPVSILIPNNMLNGRTWADYSPDSTRIVYSGLHTPGGYREDQEIFTINPDGTNLMRLTFNSNCDQKPSFSPDGTKIAWQKRSDSDFGEIWVMNADGSNPHPVAATDDGYQHPVWTPDGRILSRSGWCNMMFPKSLWIVNDDGSNLQMISPPGMEVTIDYDADSSGRYVISKNSWGWGLPQIQMIDLIDPANPVLMEPYGLLMCNTMPRFQPGTLRLLFKDRSPSWWCQLYSMNLDRTGFLALTQERVKNEYQLSDDALHVTLDHDYIFRVEGVWLASDVSHGGTNYMPGGHHEEWSRQITLGTPLSAVMGDRVPVIVSYSYFPDRYCASRPNYSADGQWISYISERDGYWAVWVMRWDGAMKTRLTFNTDDQRGRSHRLPAIRPDKKQVLFSSLREGTWDEALATIGADIDTIPGMPHALREK
jgi:Tol biopolymer transport system component